MNRKQKGIAVLALIGLLLGMVFSVFVSVHVMHHNSAHADCLICSAITVAVKQLERVCAVTLIAVAMVLAVQYYMQVFGMPFLHVCKMTLVTQCVRLDR